MGGATVDNSIIPAYSTWVPSLSDQVETWTAHLAPRPGYAPWTPANALFAVWIGVNDVGNSFSQPGEEVRLSRDLDRLFVLLGKLYACGARKFALLNIPRKSSPAESTPGSLLTDVISNPEDTHDERSELNRHGALDHCHCNLEHAAAYPSCCFHVSESRGKSHIG